MTSSSLAALEVTNIGGLRVKGLRICIYIHTKKGEARGLEHANSHEGCACIEGFWDCAVLGPKSYQ